MKAECQKCHIILAFPENIRCPECSQSLTLEYEPLRSKSIFPDEFNNIAEKLNTRPDINEFVKKNKSKNKIDKNQSLQDEKLKSKTTNQTIQNENIASELKQESKRTKLPVKLLLVLMICIVGIGLLYTSVKEYILNGSSSESILYFNSQYHVSGPVPINQEKWKFNAKGRIAAKPAYMDGLIIIGSEKGHVFAIDEITGKATWIYENIGGVITASPFVKDNVLYIGASDKYISAFKIDSNSKKGEQQWFKELSGKIYASPIVIGNTLYVAADDNYVYALDVSKRGQLIWKSARPMNNISFGSPVFDNGLLFMTSTDGSIYVYDTEDNGKLVQTFSTDPDNPKPIYTSPLLTKNSIFVLGTDHYLYKINRNQLGKNNYKYTTKKFDDSFLSSPTIHENTLYFGSSDHYMYAWDIEKWQLRWKFKTAGKILSSPAIVDSVVYFGSFDGHLYALDDKLQTTKPELLWKRKLGKGDPISSSPIVINGTVYIGSLDGYLYAIK